MGGGVLRHKTDSNRRPVGHLSAIMSLLVLYRIFLSKAHHISDFCLSQPGNTATISQSNSPQVLSSQHENGIFSHTGNYVHLTTLPVEIRPQLLQIIFKQSSSKVEKQKTVLPKGNHIRASDMVLVKYNLFFTNTVSRYIVL